MKKGGKDSTKEQIILMKSYNGEWRRMWEKNCADCPIQSENKKKKLFKMKAVLHNEVP